MMYNKNGRMQQTLENTGYTTFLNSSFPVICVLVSSLLSASEERFNQPFVVAVVGLSCAGVGRSALSGIIRHHSDHVQQTGEQLQGEVEDTNPQT